MKQLIYSKPLEQRLQNIHARSLRRIYSIPSDPYTIFELVCQTNDITIASNIMDGQMFSENFIGEKEYPYYWFNSNSEKPKYFCRVFILGESEEYLLNVFKDNLLVLL